MTTVQPSPALRYGSHPARPRGSRLRRWWTLPPLRARAVDSSISTAAGRLLMVLVILVGAVSSVLLRLSDLPAAGWLLAAWLQAGPGLLVVLALGMRAWHRIVFFGIVVSQSLLVVLTFTPAYLTGHWYPRAAAALIAVVTLVSAGVALRRDWHSRRRPTLPDRSTVLAALAPLGGLLVVILAAWLHRGDPQPGGMAVTAGPLWFVGAALVLLSLGSALLRRRSLVLPVLSISSVVVLGQAVMYGEPTVTVAARHLGIVDSVFTFGGLRPDLDIYQTWAGLFTATALVLWLAGGSVPPFAYAALWGALAAPIMVLGVRTLGGRLLSHRAAWLAGLVFGLGSALTTSFFAPQVLGFLLTLAVLSLVLGVPDAAAAGRALRWGAVIVLSLVTIVTHQISPYMLGFALGVLCLFRLIKPWWTPLVPLVPAAVWALTNREVLTRYVSPETFGRLLSNLTPPEHPDAPGGVALVNRLTFLVPAATLVLVGVLALLVLYRRPDRLHWALAATAASPGLLAVGTNYGQEGIFRVVLFALPWLALLCGRGADAPRRRHRARGLAGRVTAHPVALVVSVVLFFGVNVLGLTGMDWVRVIRTDDVTTTQWYERNAAPGAQALTLGTQVATPSQSTGHYLDVGYVGREDLLDDDQPYPDPNQPYDPVADLDMLTDAFAAEDASEHYLMVAPVTGAYGQRYGFQTLAHYGELAEAAEQSPRWDLVLSTGNTRLYRLVDRG